MDRLASRARPVCQPMASSPWGFMRMVSLTRSLSPWGQTFTSPNGLAVTLRGSCMRSPRNGGAAGASGPSLTGKEPGDGRVELAQAGYQAVLPERVACREFFELDHLCFV